MIFVTRSPAPPSLRRDDEESHGSKEFNKFVTAFETNNKLPKTDDYKAYKKDDVGRELRKLFHGKCAYCESSISGSSQNDIEHYRPKGGVKDADDVGVDHPGYWWLGMAWDNLLLSCMHCNQHRKQLIFDPSWTDAEIAQAIEENELRTTGKKNAFPTRSDTWVTAHDGDAELHEEPLLIDPTRTDPEDLFEWEFREQFTTVKPKNGDDRAAATIEVLGLNRRWLTEDRAKRVILLETIAASIRSEIQAMLDEDDDDVAEGHQRSAMEKLPFLHAFGDSRQPFAGMSRAFFEQLKQIVEEAIT